MISWGYLYKHVAHTVLKILDAEQYLILNIRLIDTKLAEYLQLYLLIVQCKKCL